MNPLTSQELFGLLHTSVIVANQSGQIAYVNDAAEAMLGKSARWLAGVDIESLFVSGDLNAGLVQQCFKQKGQWQISDAEIVTQQERLNGCRVTLSYQLVEQEPIVVIEIMGPDDHVGARREYQLLEQDKISLSLVRNLAHEIKNPLSGLRGAAQLLSRKLSVEHQKYTDVIVAEADRLQNLVDRMLTPAKIEAKRWINPHKITERLFDFASLQELSSIRLKRDYDPSLPDLCVAEEQIYQAALNLFRNACDALEGEGEITIKTRAVHQHSVGPEQYPLMVRIDIVDDGPGISEELQHLMFFPTISGKGSSGLGLGIAQSLVRQNSGIIEFESQPGKTCFSIFLPIESRSNHE